MAGFGYHSPQFSEDIAWLPAWLQPHQPTTFGDSAKDGKSSSGLACRTLVSQENVSDGPGIQSLSKENGMFSDCQLFISAEDDSTTRSTSGNVRHLHLHLSSGGVSQLSSGLLDDKFLAESCGAHEAKIASTFPGVQAVHDKASYPTKADVQDLSSGFKLGPCCSKVLSELPQERNFNTEQINQVGFQQKIDARKLKKADVNDTVELSIAASEALAISQILSTSLHSEPLSGAVLLDVALQVKQARNQNHLDILESVSTFSSDPLDETDQLCDLDEESMIGAYDDVGLCLSQIVVNLEGICSGNSPHDTHSSDKDQRVPQSISSPGFKTAMSDNYSGYNGQVQNKMVNAQDSIDSSIKKVFQNADALNITKVDSKDGRMARDGKLFEQNDRTMRSRQETIVRETSFISESIETMNERRSEQLAEAETEIIASSGTPLNTFARNKRSAREGVVLSQDPMRSSSLSCADILCSIVPCSILSDDAPCIELNHEIQDTIMDDEKYTIPIQHVGPLNSHEKSFSQNADMPLPSKPLYEGNECGLSEFSAKGSGEPTRKLLSSLRPYSTAVPGVLAAMEVPFLVENVSPESIKEKIAHLFSNKQKTSCFVSGKGDFSTVPLNLIDKCVDVDGQDIKGYHVEEPAIREIKDDDISEPPCQQEERCLPIVLNNNNGHRLRACKMTLSSDKVDNSALQSSEQNTRKHKLKHFLPGASWRDQADDKLLVSPRSSLHPHPANIQVIPKKKVRFTEARINFDRIEALKRVHGRARRRKNESSLPRKPSTGKENCPMTETRMIFQGLEFLLTGFSSHKVKELEALIRRCGGYVLSNIPSCSSHPTVRRNLECSSWKTPIVLSPKKVQSTKFLYGCAINTWILNADWLLDSLQAGSALHPAKYMIKPIQASERKYLRIGEPIYSKRHSLFFDRVGALLYGKTSFCSKFSKIIKHGGGQVYKSLQRLVQSLRNGRNSVGAVLVEDERSVSRHLKHCAMENNLPTVPASWIINSLFSGKLLPFKKNRYAPLHKIKVPTFLRNEAMDMSQEI